MKRITALLGLLIVTSAHAESLELHKGDHICLIGNALADRMQHYGWLETLIESRFPDSNLVIRDLGFAGDEIDLKGRIRSKDF
ncbi:MAG TPA: hypothetical protein VGX70_18755, partial [Gemmataceae bacterium]|nr:hypothetical protein [Gemmataceae bacterium]